jgi:hypothetical protein
MACGVRIASTPSTFVVVDAGLQGRAIARRIGVAEDVDGVGARPGGRQQFVELGDGGGR